MKIAAVTHVRNDDFYLGKWVDHYGRLLGRENLHILLDGADTPMLHAVDAGSSDAISTGEQPMPISAIAATAR